VERHVVICRVTFIPLLASLILIGGITRAQQYRGPQDFSGALQVPLPFPDSYPPVRADMPMHIKTDILFFDSIVRSVSIPYGGLDPMIASLNDEVQLKDAVKRLYEIDDYDPIAYFQLLRCEPNGKSDPKRAYSLTSPSYVINSLMSKADKLLADSGVSVALAQTDLIFQVTVLDTFTVEHQYPGSFLARWVRVTCRIDDIFKGHRIPSCLTGVAQDSIPRLIDPAIGNCFQFEYSTQWAA
jgi:hypothetical protein